MPSSTAFSTVKKTAFIAAVVGVIAFIPLRFIAGYRSSRDSITARHEEVHAAIEEIYAHFQQHGSWPEKSQTSNLPPDFSDPPSHQAVDLTSLPALRQPVPQDWKYESDSELGGPYVYLDGSYHMSIVYYFAPPEGGQVGREWTRSEEGSKYQFNSSRPYAMPSGK